MNGVDIGSVESISILKDASATAVFGVKGANGVILITTKRGVEGKANINVIVNSTVKIPSRLPQKYDSYDALKIRNRLLNGNLALVRHHGRIILHRQLLINIVILRIHGEGTLSEC